MKQILLVDLSIYRGHHGVYFEQILKILVKNNFYVYCSSADNERLGSFIEKNSLKNVEIVEPEFKLIDKVLYRLIFLFSKFFQRSLKEIIPILQVHFLIKRRVGKNIPVFFAHLDSYIPPNLSLNYARYFLPREWSGLYIVPPLSRQGGDSHLEYIKKSEGILMLDESFVKLYNNKLPLFKNVYWIPELLYFDHRESFLSQQILEKAGERSIISFVGSIVWKKNFSLFLRAAEKLPKDKYFIVVIGLLNRKNHSEAELVEIDKLIDKIEDNSYIDLDQFIETEEEFNSLMYHSDLIYLHYRDHPYSSNQLIKAIGLGKPVIVNQGGLMENVVNRYAWMSICGGGAQQISDAIEYTLNTFDISQTLHHKFLKDFSGKVFEQSILKVIQS